MKITFKTTYDAGKLASAMPKIIHKYLQTAVRSSVKGAKERIDKGLSTPLSGSNIEIRKMRGRTGTKPLYETGALHKSIEIFKGQRENFIKMNKYGIYHQRGYKTVKNRFTKWYHRETGKEIGKKVVPARPFIMPSEKDITPAFEVLRKGIRKNFKK